jgi:hypothetical protein
MMGRNHLIVTGAAIGGLGYPAMRAGQQFAANHDVAQSGPWAGVEQAAQHLGEAVGGGAAGVLDAAEDLAGSLAYALVVNPLHIQGDHWPITALIAVALMLGGSLLPDIDSPNSMAGRRLKRPVPWLGPHRSITHANWVPIGLFAASFGASAVAPGHPRLGAVFYALAWGYLGHLVADGFSHAGRAPWWPLGRWSLGPGGVVISQSRAVGARWYAVGSLGEHLVVIVFTALMALSFIGFWRAS